MVSINKKYSFQINHTEGNKKARKIAEKSGFQIKLKIQAKLRNNRGIKDVPITELQEEEQC
jgi:protein involved in sex pheromone biosynthesis